MEKGEEGAKRNQLQNHHNHRATSDSCKMINVERLVIRSFQLHTNELHDALMVHPHHDFSLLEEFFFCRVSLQSVEQLDSHRTPRSALAQVDALVDRAELSLACL